MIRQRRGAILNPISLPYAPGPRPTPAHARPYYVGAVGGLPVLRRLETAVTSCAGANGFANMMLLGTPFRGPIIGARPAHVDDRKSSVDFPDPARDFPTVQPTLQANID